MFCAIKFISYSAILLSFLLSFPIGLVLLCCIIYIIDITMMVSWNMRSGFMYVWKSSLPMYFRSGSRHRSGSRSHKKRDRSNERSSKLLRGSQHNSPDAMVEAGDAQSRRWWTPCLLVYGRKFDTQLRNFSCCNELVANDLFLFGAQADIAYTLKIVLFFVVFWFSSPLILLQKHVSQLTKKFGYALFLNWFFVW